MTAPRPLSARSVVLSLALGAHPEPLTAAGVVRTGEHLGLTGSTLRVALSRAAAAGELQRDDAGRYLLGERLVRRQRRQDEAVRDAERSWDGAWELAIVVVAGRSGPERAALRERLTEHRLAELREGVWTRPANLRRPRGYLDEAVLSTFAGTPDEDPRDLAAALWDLNHWARVGRGLLDELSATTAPGERLAVAAGVVRHLTVDPLLPAALLPRDWPAGDLRAAYADYQASLRALTAS